MARFNVIRPRGTSKTINKAGGRAFKFSSEVELIHATLTTFLDDKFYESGGERMARLQELVGKVSPEFVAKLAIIARKEFHLRSVSHLLLGELAKSHRGDDLVKRAIVAFTERPDDLTELAAYVGLPMPKQVKRGIRNAILKFDRYQLAKYQGNNKAFGLVDLFNMTHPKVQFASEEQAIAWKDLMEGNLKVVGTWESEVSNAEGEEGRKEAWEFLVKEGKMGYMALLRNLNNLIKNDVDEATIKAAIKQLTDPERVKKSKQLPFRFLTAYGVVSGNRLFTDAISEAMDIAVSNVPEFEGKTLIAVDKSGSMSGDPLEKAAIFAATLAKANKSADVMLFANDAKDYTVSSRLPVIDTAQKIIGDNFSGGTNTGSVFQKAGAKKYDRIFILSDNESWMDSTWGGGTQQYLDAYKAKSGADPYVYAMDIAGYGTKDVQGSKVFHLAGFSDRVLDFVGLIEKGQSLVDHIKQYEF